VAKVYNLLVKHKKHLFLAILFLPIPVAIFSYLLAKLFIQLSIPIASGDIFSFYGVVFSILFTVIGVLLTIELALKEKQDKENADTIPILVLEPKEVLPCPPDTQLLLASNFVKKVSEPLGVRTDYFSITNFGQQAAINIMLNLGEVHLLVGSLPPYSSHTIALHFAEDIHADKTIPFTFRCRTIRGETVDFLSEVSIEANRKGVACVGVRLFPTINPLVFQSSVTVTRVSGFFHKKQHSKVVRSEQQSTRQELFK